MSKDKCYLGDSVYADCEGDMVVLTTENGYGATNTIYLEAATFHALLRWIKQVTDATAAAAAGGGDE